MNRQLAFECVMMSLRTRVLPNKHETPADFAKRLYALGEVIMKEIESENTPAAPASLPGESEPEDVSEEYEPEETLTEDQQVKTYTDEDGQEDWHVADAPSAPFPSCKDSASGDAAERLDRLARAKCPQCCRRAYSEESVDAQFGYRTMADGVVRVQSWCRVCRAAGLKAGSTSELLPTYSKFAYGIPAGMGPAQFRKLFARVSGGRTVLQVYLDDSLRGILNDGWPVKFSRTKKWD